MQQIYTYFVPKGSSEDPDGVLKNDADYQLGKAVYTSIRTYAGKPFRLEKHMLRLQASAQLLGIELKHPLEEIKKALQVLVSKNTKTEHFLKISLTPNNVVIISRPLHIDESIYKGVSLGVAELEREIVEAKTFPTENIKMAYEKAALSGHHDVLLVDKKGNITEGSRSNILWIKGNALYFCSHALGGITQEEVIRCAADLFDTGIIECIQKTSTGLPLDELGNIDELFLTQTSRGIVPVTRVGDISIANGKVGPKTLILRQQFQKNTQHTL